LFLKTKTIFVFVSQSIAFIFVLQAAEALHCIASIRGNGSEINKKLLGLLNLNLSLKVPGLFSKASLNLQAVVFCFPKLWD